MRPEFSSRSGLITEKHQASLRMEFLKWGSAIFSETMGWTIESNSDSDSDVSLVGFDNMIMREDYEESVRELSQIYQDVLNFGAGPIQSVQEQIQVAEEAAGAAVEEVNEDKDCPICLRELPQDNWALLICNHKFCHVCVDHIMARNEARNARRLRGERVPEWEVAIKCGLCRAKTKKEDLRSIFTRF